MANFEVVDAIPSTYKLRSLGEGANGNTYITSDGDVYKEFKGLYTYGEELERLSETVSPSFAFPNMIIYLGRKSSDTIKGYRMDYISGTRFDALDPKTRISVLLEAAKKVEKDIILLAKYSGIVLYDVNRANVILQNDDTLKVIDTDLFMYLPSSEVYENLKLSMKEWNEFLLYTLKGGTTVFKSGLLNWRHEVAVFNGKLRASEVIEAVLSEIRQTTHEDVSTLEEYYEGLKLIKREECL